MANIMNPVFPVGGVERTASPAKSAEPSGDTFSDHLDRKLQEQRSHNDKVGVARREEQRRELNNNSKAKEDGLDDEISADAGDEAAAMTLALFMQDLQQVTNDSSLGVGEWGFPVEDKGFLEDLAANAGMSEVDLLALVENFQGDNKSVDLSAFFQTMQDHFDHFESDPGVLLPETELPLLESLLSKMGLTAEQLALLSEKAVAGEGVIDLSTFTDAIAQLLAGETNLDQSLQPVTLSATEAQQLQDLLSKAGLNLGEQLELLPEPLLGKDVVLSFERLQSMLEQSVHTAEAEFPKIDLVGFLKDLESVMQGAQFTDQSAGIAPLVQNSLMDVYKDFLEMFEDITNRFNEGLAREESLFTEDMANWRTGVAERLAELIGIDSEDIKVQSTVLPEGSTLAGSSSASSEVASEQPGMMSTSSSIPDSLVQPNASNDQPPPTRHFSSQQQQQIFNQLSLAVARGVKSGEHHLTLRLHPVELGDVKVDLVMKGDEISAHFNIANSKVKETLETSMDEFRQEMEQKGFTLGALNVSVGGQDNRDETMPRFEMAWSGERLQAETLEDLPDGVLYQQGLGEQYANQDQGVNLFV